MRREATGVRKKRKPYLTPHPSPLTPCFRPWSVEERTRPCEGRRPGSIPGWDAGGRLEARRECSVFSIQFSVQIPFLTEH